ncbi:MULTISPECIES: DUF6228 family protein [Arthrobacter]|uniref:DUF6228 family protein n=2 Tax=Arthrobacter TaxID=1663 RepID=A0ABU9KKL3_9MICC|nr:DUF6228 family protein [Arthrobacter sp. YJM1]MDP5227336.1 DUF6228 family protein [Arthrobacter sp. YJM1]
MGEVSIGRRGSLILKAGNDDRARSGAVEYLMVTLVAEGLTSTSRIYDVNGFGTLVGYFDDLSRHWRGWDGSKMYESLEGDLRISARHDGRVRLEVTLNQILGETEWRCQSTIILDPGEELSFAAAALQELLNPAIS